MKNEAYERRKQISKDYNIPEEWILALQLKYGC